MTGDRVRVERVTAAATSKGQAEYAGITFGIIGKSREFRHYWVILGVFWKFWPFWEYTRNLFGFFRHFTCSSLSHYSA